MLNGLAQLDNGAVYVTASPTDTWESLCDYGRELAELEDRIQWAFVDLCEKIRTSGQYGSGRMNDFAKEIDRSRTFVYDRARVGKFYDHETVRAFISHTPLITFEKCLLLTRYMHTVDEAIVWLNRVADDVTYTYAKLKMELELHFVGTPKPNAPLFDGIYRSTELKDIVNALPDGEYKTRIDAL